MWWNDKIYFLDFGMVGEVGPEMREQLMLLLMAFWQEDVGVPHRRLADARRRDRPHRPRRRRVPGGDRRADGALPHGDLADIQLGPILQEMTEISLRHGVPLPASLTLTGKALAQMQLATAALDPDSTRSTWPARS